MKNLLNEYRKIKRQSLKAFKKEMLALIKKNQDLFTQRNIGYKLFKFKPIRVPKNIPMYGDCSEDDITGFQDDGTIWYEGFAGGFPTQELDTLAPEDFPWLISLLNKKIIQARKGQQNKA